MLDVMPKNKRFKGRIVPRPPALDALMCRTAKRDRNVCLEDGDTHFQRSPQHTCCVALRHFGAQESPKRNSKKIRKEVRKRSSKKKFEKKSKKKFEKEIRKKSKKKFQIEIHKPNAKKKNTETWQVPWAPRQNFRSDTHAPWGPPHSTAAAAGPSVEMRCRAAVIRVGNDGSPPNSARPRPSARPRTPSPRRPAVGVTAAGVLKALH